MRTSLVLTIIGEDRPGIVEQVSDQVLAAGGNWEESRMARLAGRFAGILRVSVEAGRADDLTARLKTFNPGLSVVVERSGEPAERAFRTLRIELLGNDHPGIVRDISRVLAQQQINIEELETDVTSAPMTGETLFRARANLRIPPSVTLPSLRTRLEALAGELMVDLTLEDEQAIGAGDRSVTARPKE
jgi:glycine cleavage system regulatory protein